ncbi:hypothetical protein PVK06_041104 [Gossypium arboreum]|uniref:Uncharacterized protein n=1 Tax=Gossypium arboreum TaxID=29729 RepID=A0ABR0N853_GOSAR|nr:hypothetical protein PVK06_041104 [Gossypium arboreum]
MELVDDEDVETMVALCYEECGVQDPCIVIPIAYVDRQSIVCSIDIDLNTPPVPKNLNSSPRLQIHPVVIETHANDDDGYDNNGSSDHEVEDYSDPNLDDIPDDIDDKCANDYGNVKESSVGNPSRGTMIRNDPGAHISIIDPDVTHASEFLEYLDILPTHRECWSQQKAAIGGYEQHLSRSHKCGRLGNLLRLAHALQHVGNLDAKNEAERVNQMEEG